MKDEDDKIIPTGYLIKKAEAGIVGIIDKCFYESEELVENENKELSTKGNLSKHGDLKEMF